MAKPRFMRLASQLTTGDSAVARKIAASSQPIGFRSVHKRDSVTTTQTTVRTMRTMFRTVIIRGVFAPLRAAPVGLDHEAARHGAGAEQARPGVGREHGTDLAHDRGPVPV